MIVPKLVVVTKADWRISTPDGRWNATQVGDSPPQALAKFMLIEMEEARLGNPMFRRPWELTASSVRPNFIGRIIESRKHM
jgi:hypothetical protein